jgi:hypothetical protein
MFQTVNHWRRIYFLPEKFAVYAAKIEITGGGKTTSYSLYDPSRE